MTSTHVIMGELRGERAREVEQGASQAPADSVIHTIWQIKASTLCNLRCTYCYEWDRLSDPTRIPLQNWRHIFQAMVDYRAYRAGKNGILADIMIVWHGGEPLLLPAGYVSEVLTLQRQILGPDKWNGGRFWNVAQTNLYKPNRTLDLMVAERFIFNVSHDSATDVRVDRVGRDSDALVHANLRALAARGATCGVALVLGRHNHLRLPEIHDGLEATGAAWLRINPMYQPPNTAPGGGLALSAEEIVDALARLLEHKRGLASRFPVEPLDRVWQTARRNRAGGSALKRDRRGFGETRFVVHPDGTLAHEAGSASGFRTLGNVFEQGMEEILGAAAYGESLEEDDAKRARHCAHCRYEAACNGYAMLELLTPAPQGPCPVEAKLCEIAESYLA